MITGGIKYFERNKNLEVDGTIGTATSGNASMDFALDRNPATRWISQASDDLTTETIIITFPTTITIDRILLLNINAKDVAITYDDGGPTQFTNVLKNGGAFGVSLSGINDTGIDTDTVYYEFDAVTTGSISISMTETQIADQQKFIAQIISTLEIGTFQGFPKISGNTLDQNIKSKKTLGGKWSIQKSLETLMFNISFSSYPARDSNINVDIDTAITLLRSDDPFLVWMCGGRSGTDFFGYTIPGFDLKDVVQMDTNTKFNFKYLKSVYQNPVDFKMKLVEAIDR